MPIYKTKTGYKWGKTGKVYPTKQQALAQAHAILASGYKKKKPKQLRINIILNNYSIKEAS